MAATSTCASTCATGKSASVRNGCVVAAGEIAMARSTACAATSLGASLLHSSLGEHVDKRRPSTTLRTLFPPGLLSSRARGMARHTPRTTHT